MNNENNNEVELVTENSTQEYEALILPSEKITSEEMEKLKETITLKKSSIFSCALNLKLNEGNVNYKNRYNKEKNLKKKSNPFIFYIIVAILFVFISITFNFIYDIFLVNETLNDEVNMSPQIFYITSVMSCSFITGYITINKTSDIVKSMPIKQSYYLAIKFLLSFLVVCPGSLVMYVPATLRAIFMYKANPLSIINSIIFCFLNSFFIIFFMLLMFYLFKSFIKRKETLLTFLVTLISSLVIVIPLIFLSSPITNSATSGLPIFSFMYKEKEYFINLPYLITNANIGTTFMLLTFFGLDILLFLLTALVIFIESKTYSRKSKVVYKSTLFNNTEINNNQTNIEPKTNKVEKEIKLKEKPNFYLRHNLRMLFSKSNFFITGIPSFIFLIFFLTMIILIPIMHYKNEYTQPFFITIGNLEFVYPLISIFLILPVVTNLGATTFSRDCFYMLFFKSNPIEYKKYFRIKSIVESSVPALEALLMYLFLGIYSKQSAFCIIFTTLTIPFIVHFLYCFCSIFDSLKPKTDCKNVIHIAQNNLMVFVSILLTCILFVVFSILFYLDIFVNNQIYFTFSPLDDTLVLIRYIMNFIQFIFYLVVSSVSLIFLPKFLNNKFNMIDY